MQQVMKWATDIYKDGIQPADTLTWTGSGNNENFIAKNIAQTSNGPSITFALENALAKATDAKEQEAEGGGARQPLALPHPGGPGRPAHVGHRHELRDLQEQQGPRGGHEPGGPPALPRGDARAS